MSRAATNLANFSIFALFTPYNAYKDGSAFLGDLDGLFAKEFGGMKPILKEFFMRKKGHVVTTETLRDFVESKTNVSLKDFFTKYAYGNKNPQILPSFNQEDYSSENMHPRPLTREQVLELR
jgi:hypothetical protein